MTLRPGQVPVVWETPEQTVDRYPCPGRLRRCPPDGPGQGQGRGVVDPGSDAPAGRLEALPMVSLAEASDRVTHYGRGVAMWAHPDGAPLVYRAPRG